MICYYCILPIITTVCCLWWICSNSVLLWHECMHPLLSLNTDGMRVHHWFSLRPCPCCCFDSSVTTQSASHRSCQSRLGNLTATQQREGHDLTLPTGPWYTKDLFIFTLQTLLNKSAVWRGGEKRRGTSTEASFFWNLANKEHLNHLCPAINKENSLWFANTKHYCAFCFANRGRTYETNTLCCRNKCSMFYTCQEKYFFSDLYKSFKDRSQNIFQIKKGKKMQTKRKPLKYQ